MTTITHKRGDTFTLAVTEYLDAEMQSPRDLTGVTITCQMRHPWGEDLVSLTPALTDAAAGTFTLTAADTEAWRIGKWSCDIEFDEGGVVNSSETFAIDVVEDVTR